MIKIEIDENKNFSTNEMDKKNSYFAVTSEENVTCNEIDALDTLVNSIKASIHPDYCNCNKTRYFKLVEIINDKN